MRSNYEKIEPMTVEEIKDIVGCYHIGDWRHGIADSIVQTLERVVLTWAEAEALVRRYKAISELPPPSHLGSCTPESGCDTDCMDRYYVVTRQDWLASVLREIGWPEDK